MQVSLLMLDHLAMCIGDELTMIGNGEYISLLLGDEDFVIPME